MIRYKSVEVLITQEDYEIIKSFKKSDKIKQDILDTETEIITMKREIEGLRLIGDKMSMFRANARESGIKEREIFIEKLKVILKER